MPDRFMMASAARHGFAGDISRTKPGLVVITGEDGEDWIGEWVSGLGLIHVHFPKATTRPLTAEEREQYDGRWVQSGSSEWQIRIPPGGRVSANHDRWRALRGPDLEAAMLAARWFVQPEDTIGGWCVTVVDLPPSAGSPRVADFLSRACAEHIVRLHNADLALHARKDNAA